MPLEEPAQRHLRSARGYIELGMLDEANGITGPPTVGNKSRNAWANISEIGGFVLTNLLTSPH